MGEDWDKVNDLVKEEEKNQEELVIGYTLCIIKKCTERDIHSMKLATKGRGSIYEKKEKTDNQ
jgi:hypothetical protein